MADSDDATPGGTDGPGEITTTPRRRRSGRHLGVLIGLTGVVAVLIGLGVFFGLRVLHTDIAETRRETALQTARQFSLDLITINYRTAEQNVQRVIDGSTERFPEEFFGVDGPAFVEVARQEQLEYTGEVTSAAVERVDENSARVLAAVRFTVRGVTTPMGTTLNHRWGVELEWASDRWLVSKVEILP